MLMMMSTLLLFAVACPSGGGSSDATITCNSGEHLRNNVCRSFTGVFTRVGTATSFGITVGNPNGLAASGTTLYMVGAGNEDALYTLNTTTGVATLVGDGTVTDFGVSEASVAAIAFHTVSGTENLYMVGTGKDILYTLDTSTGVATRVGSATTFGSVNELSPRGLASVGDVLYMVGSTNDALYTLDTSTGEATQVGSATTFGSVNEEISGGLTAIDNVLYMVGATNDALYWLDMTTGVATMIGSGATASMPNGLSNPSGLASIGDTLYVVNPDIVDMNNPADALYSSTLPTN